MFKKTQKFITGAASLGIGLLFPLNVLAAQPSGELVPQNIRGINNIVSVIRAIIQFILVVAFVLAFVMLLIGGIRWITAGGDEKAVGSARNMITAALIGLVIVLVAYALIKLVETFFGLNIISGGVNIPQVGDAPQDEMAIFTVTVFYILGIIVTPVYAAPADPAQLSAIVKILENIINILAPAAGIAFFIMILWGGFQFLNSGGDPKAAGQARTTLTYAIIGIVLVVASWLILKIIADATGVNVTTVNLPI